MGDTVVIKGAEIALEIKERLRQEVDRLGIQPCLSVVLVGDDEESRRYVRLKEKAVADIGARCEIINLSAAVGLGELLHQVERLNADPAVHGILVQLPLPGPLGENQETVLASIEVSKDVDGFHPFNRGQLLAGRARFASCAALACLELAERYIDLSGLRSVLIGNSFDLIRPLALMLMTRGSRVEVFPDAKDWEEAVQAADLLVVEQGHPRMITGNHIKPGVFIIDAGFHWESGHVCGNIDTVSVTGRAGWLAPVPGGMGPVLIAKLLENLVEAAR